MYYEQVTVECSALNGMYMSSPQDSGNIREERAETAQELEDRKKCYQSYSGHDMAVAPVNSLQQWHSAQDCIATHDHG